MPEGVIIEGRNYRAREFAYDGCHKIYLLDPDNASEREKAEEWGYGIRPITDLERTYRNSCPLRFISTWDLTECPVGQFFEEDRGRAPRIRVV